MTKKAIQDTLFEVPTEIERHWTDMPEYNNTEIDGPEITWKFNLGMKKIMKILKKK